MAMLTSGMALTRRDFVSFTSEYTLTLTQLSHYLIILFNLIINKREVDSSVVSICRQQILMFLSSSIDHSTCLKVSH